MDAKQLQPFFAASPPYFLSINQDGNSTPISGIIFIRHIHFETFPSSNVRRLLASNLFTQTEFFLLLSGSNHLMMSTDYYVLRPGSPP